MKQTIAILEIVLDWSRWVAWNDLSAARAGAGAQASNRVPGVYEAKRSDAPERLTIGKVSNLRYRFKQCPVKDDGLGAVGQGIRANEYPARIVVRWAVTERAAAAEEWHKRSKAKLGKNPKYTNHT